MKSFVLLISCLLHCGWEKSIDVSSVFMNLLKFALCPHLEEYVIHLEECSMSWVMHILQVFDKVCCISFFFFFYFSYIKTLIFLLDVHTAETGLSTPPTLTCSWIYLICIWYLPHVFSAAILHAHAFTGSYVFLLTWLLHHILNFCVSVYCFGICFVYFM